MQSEQGFSIDTTYDSEMNSLTKKTFAELYKELEHINAQELITRKDVEISTRKNADNLKIAIIRYITWLFKKRDVVLYTQGEAFQYAMRLSLICGQCAGLNPVIGVLDKDIAKVRFKVRSPKFVYSCFMCLVQMVASVTCLYKIFEGPMTLRKCGNFSFYFSVFLTSILFLRLAMKWKYLMSQVTTADLNEYIDPAIKWKCDLATVALFGSAILEHILSFISTVSTIMDCTKTSDDMFGTIIEKIFFMSFNVEVQYSLPLGVGLLVTNFITTLTWSYLHIFIVCISIYLTSLLEEINKKIASIEGEYFPETHWRKLREDYNRATRLVSIFDDHISGIMFLSFATHLLFICLQLYNTLSDISHTYSKLKECPNFPSGPFNGYELPISFMYTLIFIISRFLAVALIASRVHTESRTPASALYSVPSEAYCTEVERFIQQVQGNFIALSGLKFFYVTKEVLLSVAATVVTYELVLLQIDD